MILATPDSIAAAYTEYRHHEGYRKRARLLRDFPEPILVVGCGFGYLVRELQLLDKVVWGVDASEYAVANRATHNVSQLDITTTPVPRSFSTIVTEDLLPWLTDTEAQAAANNCAAHGAIVIHLVTVDGDADYNYHSPAQWMTLTHQLTVSLEGM